MPKRSPSRPVVMWFRDDLRLSDNPALHAAAATGQPVLAVYVLDEESPELRPLGGASRWWLHFSLASLADRLRAIGGSLALFRGAATQVVPMLAKEAGATTCYWNRRYDAAERVVDAAVEAALGTAAIAAETHGGKLLHEPDEVQSKAGGAFRVFTPFLRASLALGPPSQPLPAPTKLLGAATPTGTVTLEALALLPTTPDWAGGLRETWKPGEPDAVTLLQTFIEGGLAHYGEDRNLPSVAKTSRLSPHLRFGEMSPRQAVSAARHAAASGAAATAEVDKFVSEVVWRDFAYTLLTAHPDLATEPVQPAFRFFPYRVAEPATLHAWQHGRTGYPIVDAGMRQLWRTGVMHNRVRMIAASFLVKHLLLDWRLGEAWFWDTLCDADPASNPVNWQWIAGSGADPSPYFRIFNPTLQGEKFDPDGAYVRAFVPELKDLPAKWIHRPWDAPRPVLDAARVRLGETYPQPIVEHEVARKRALAALAEMREKAAAA